MAEKQAILYKKENEKHKLAVYHQLFSMKLEVGLNYNKGAVTRLIPLIQQRRRQQAHFGRNECT